MKKMKLLSQAFQNNGKIPAKYTCDGKDINPPFEFLNVPEEARSLAFIVEDPDAPGKTWIHWIVFNIDSRTTHIAENSIPAKGVQAVTDFGNARYRGPCPPNGTHRYYFKLFALDKKLNLTEDVTLDELEKAMEKHILDKSGLIGLYSRE